MWHSSFLGSEIAVKVLNRANNSSLDAAVKKESDLLASLRHPSICTFYGVCSVAMPMGKLEEGLAIPLLGIVLEYLSGGTLSDYLELNQGDTHHEGDGVRRRQGQPAGRG